MARRKRVPFKVGEASPANTFLAIWMGQAAGFYEAQGLDLEIVPMVGGSKTGPALAEGRVQLMHIGLSSVVRACAAGYRTVAIGSLSNINRGTLFGAPGVSTAEDLKGGTVGISSAGSESELAAIVALEKLGVARTDVSFKEIGVDRRAAVRDGSVAAAMFGEPHRSELIAAGMRPIVDLLDERLPWLYSGLVVDRAWFAANRDPVKRFIRATVEGNYLAVHDETGAKTVLTRELGITDSANLASTYDDFRNHTPLDAAVTHDGAANVVRTVNANGASSDAADFLDDSIHGELAAEGFFTAMDQKYRS